MNPPRMNHWVDPSFSDLPEKSFSLPGRRRRGGVQAQSPSPEVKRLKKRRAADSSCLLGPVPPRDQAEPWVERYAPSSRAQLAVHKKKIEDVESWMREHTSPSKGGVLLLTGPSGCGKTATVQVLSTELGIRVQEWTNPSLPDAFVSRKDGGWRPDDGVCSSQLGQFREFLLRANKYNCLKMAGDAQATGKKLILVEEFPNQFYRQPGSLHDVLRIFVKTNRCPLVFIVTDSVSGDGSVRSLFPRDLQQELDISCISFNPVAPTAMMKVLRNISNLEAGKGCVRMRLPDQAELDTLCSGSPGDIRSVINNLQFFCLQDTSLEKDLLVTEDRPTLSVGRAAPRAKQRTRKSKQTKQPEGQQAVGGKDATLFLFRALGKILHCKRESPAAGPGPVLPSHLQHHHRDLLAVDPELIVERSHVKGELFNLYLHQNYVDFFSEMEDLDRASEYLSDADLLTADWTSRSFMGEYGSSVAVRGLLHSNSHQVSVGFRPLHKPGWLLAAKKHQENRLTAQFLFRSFCATADVLNTQLLPYLAKLSSPMRNPAQITFIQEVGQISLKKQSRRLSLETLTDKDTAHVEEEEDENPAEGEPEAALAGSQPQPATNTALSEDLLIEEYASD
ncbi:cell cycle checkpoint protein RAD17 [Cololabis saira]|uniref:cell cycle checkpoint protein RAD17 n=1 Tax=Cololabis saira TaxID=129043 RepID=UPI002AD57EF8|nr:cell cycle checkpoint protein RAD17 [Cololabis saira]